MAEKKVTRSKTLNMLERVVYLVIPLFSAAVSVILSYVSVSAQFGVTPKEYVASSLLTAFFYLLFYFPCRALFKDMYMSKKRIQMKVLEYSVRSTLVYDGHIRELADFCDKEFELRKKNYINKNLQIVDFDYDFFVKNYKFDKSLVKRDDTLSRKQKNALCKLIFFVPMIKKQDYEALLPGAEFGTSFKRVKSSMNKSSRFGTGRKVITATMLAFAVMSITITYIPDAAPIEIIVQILIRLAGGITQVMWALLSANSLVNRTYFSELSEKNLFLDEFIEDYKLNDELNVIMASAKDQIEDGGIIVVKRVVQQNVVTQPLIEEKVEDGNAN